MYKNFFLALAIVFIGVQSPQAQENNPISTGVLFLTVSPESRAGAMGDVGVATTPDVNSMHWNPSKFAFIEKDGGVSLSYTPWLRNLVGDIDLVYLTGYKRIDKQQVIAASLRYFSLGQIEFRSITGDFERNVSPNEMALDAAYSRKFGSKLSGGIAFRYIRSDLTKGFGEDSKVGQAFAADISMYYNDKIKISDKEGKLAFGLDISNIGNQLSYSTDTRYRNFLPTNLRLGSALTIDINSYNSIMLGTDITKLLVPTPPIRKSGSDSIQFGKNNDVGVIEGIFQSFGDAPGVLESDGSRSVFKEELHEITYSVGVEYWYRKQFAMRGGYFAEHVTKGNRKYYTLGVGLRLNVFSLDFSYLIPSAANSPLGNTMRFTLSLDFDAFRNLNNN